MRRVKMFGLLAIAAGALLVPVGTASAADSYTCAFNGVTGGLSPAIPSILADRSPDFEDGTFTFSGAVTCAGNNGVETGTVDASGTYRNILCGTGNATGNATVSVPSNTVNVGFTIDFVGGNGAIRITSGATGTGDAQLVPINHGNCVDTDVTDFDVFGGFSAAINV